MSRHAFLRAVDRFMEDLVFSCQDRLRGKSTKPPLWCGRYEDQLVAFALVWKLDPRTCIQLKWGCTHSRAAMNSLLFPLIAVRFFFKLLYDFDLLE